MRTLGFALTVGLSSACSSGTGPGCEPTEDQYFIDVDVRVEPQVSCVLHLYTDDASARYEFPEVCSSDPHQGVTFVGDAPVPSHASSGYCRLRLTFIGDAAVALADYMHERDFQMTVLCEGNMVVTQKVHPSRWSCGG